jgi:hypothetical protein
MLSRLHEWGILISVLPGSLTVQQCEIYGIDTFYLYLNFRDIVFYTATIVESMKFFVWQAMDKNPL